MKNDGYIFCVFSCTVRVCRCSNPQHVFDWNSKCICILSWKSSEQTGFYVTSRQISLSVLTRGMFQLAPPGNTPRPTPRPPRNEAEACSSLGRACLARILTYWQSQGSGCWTTGRRSLGAGWEPVPPAASQPPPKQPGLPHNMAASYSRTSQVVTSTAEGRVPRDTGRVAWPFLP